MLRLSITNTNYSLSSDLMEPMSNFYENSDQDGNDFDPNAFIDSCYFLPCLQATLEITSENLTHFSDEKKRKCEWLQQIESFDRPGGNDCSPYRSILDNGSAIGSVNELKSLPGLHFRDHIWVYTQKFLAAEAIETADPILENVDYEDEDEAKKKAGYDMNLIQLLVACAEAVGYRDKLYASTLLSDLQVDSLAFGTSFQRVASCFIQGLSDRLALVQPAGALMTPCMAISSEREKTLSLVYEICPQIQFAHFVANASILEAFEEEHLLHVVDLGMTLGLRHGRQWRSLISSLATRAGRPCHLRITGVGNRAFRLRLIGDELKEYAHSLGLKFDFSVIESNLEDLQGKDFKILNGEVLVINSILQLHYATRESRGVLNSVLRILNELSPRLFILVEQDSSHNGPFFLGRFMEALHYYSAIFDSLEAMLPRYDTRRAKIEQFYFGEEIKNIVSCEGLARVERHERVEQWRRRMSRAGFQPAPIGKLVQAKQWLENMQVCEGYTIVEEKGCLILGWKSKPIIAASCWKCY